MQPQLVEMLRLGGAPRLLGQVGERRPAPERERLSQVVGRIVRAPRFERRPAALEQALEAVEIELVRVDDDAVAVAGGLDPLRAERAPQPVDVHLQRLHGGCRAVPRPRARRQLLGRHHAPAVDEQQCEQRALLRRAERSRSPSDHGLDRPQDAELRRDPRPP